MRAARKTTPAKATPPAGKRRPSPPAQPARAVAPATTRKRPDDRLQGPPPAPRDSCQDLHPARVWPD